MAIARILQKWSSQVRARVSASLQRVGNVLIACGRALESDRSQSQQQNTLLQTILDSIPQAVFWKDVKGRYLGCNRSFALHAGLSSPNDIVGQTDFDMPWIREAPGYRADDRQVINSGQPKLNIDESVTSADGIRRWLKTHKIPLKNAEGAIVGVIGIFEDVSDRHRMEKALRCSEQTNRAIIRAIPDMLIRVRRDGVYLATISTGGVKILNPLQFTPGTNIFDILPAKLARERMEYVQQVLDTGEPVKYEYELVVSGELLFEEARITPCDRDDVLVMVRDISDRKRAELALRREREHFAQAQALAHVGSWELDLETDKITWSDEIFRIYGLDPSQSEPTYIEHQRQIHPGDYPRWEAAMSQLIEGCQPAAIEFRILRGDGSIRYLYGQGEPIADEEGRVVRLFGTIMDITHRKELEQAFQQAQKHLYNLVQSVNGIVWEADPATGLFLFVSDKAEKLLGYPPERWTTEPGFYFNFVVHPEDREWVQTLCQTAAQEDLDHQLEYRLVTADDRIVWVHDIVTVVVEEDASVKLRGLLIDISDRKVLEEKLRLSQQRLSLLIREAPLAMIEWDSELRVTAWNPAAESMFGYTKQEAIGRVPDFFVREEFRPQVRQRLLNLFEQPQKSQGVSEIATKDGRIIICEWHNTSLVAPNGEIIGAASMGFDITARQRAENALKKLNQELEQLAALDGLTQLANRRSFDACLEKEWQRLALEQAPLSLLLLDIDYFKRYNDHYGHPQGDTCLIQVAAALKRAIRFPTDVAARYGGEEFAVILMNTDEKGAIAVAKRIRQTLKDLAIPHARSPISDIVTASMGIASMVPAILYAPDRLVQQADRALYQAKQAGRDRFCWETWSAGEAPLEFTNGSSPDVATRDRG